MLKEVVWTCECGTTLRYWNKLRQIVHLDSQKHQQFEVDGVVIKKKKEQRWRRGDDVKIEKLCPSTDKCESS
jgi:threonine dehydrogenase-like Zn-dependent dehydrogenase